MWGLAQTHVAGPMRPGMILPQCADEKKTVSGPHCSLLSFNVFEIFYSPHNIWGNI